MTTVCNPYGLHLPQDDNDGKLLTHRMRPFDLF